MELPIVRWDSGWPFLAPAWLFCRLQLFWDPGIQWRPQPTICFGLFDFGMPLNIELPMETFTKLAFRFPRWTQWWGLYRQFASVSLQKACPIWSLNRPFASASLPKTCPRWSLNRLFASASLQNACPRWSLNRPFASVSLQQTWSWVEPIRSDPSRAEPSRAEYIYKLPINRLSGRVCYILKY